MLAKRIIPTLLVRGRTLVKGERFDSWRSIGHALQGAKVHAKRGVDELLILDIAATAEGRGPDLAMVSELAEGCFIPITVGGGVRTLEDIRALLLSGADKVAIGAAWRENPLLVREAAARFGSQAIVCLVDVKEDALWNGGRPVPSDFYDWPRWLWMLQNCGAGEIVLQAVDRDGTLAGYDLAMIAEAAKWLNIPLIVSGGCSGYPDMLAAFKAGADACAAGALFAFTDSTPKGAARFLHDNGVAVRCF